MRSRTMILGTAHAALLALGLAQAMTPAARADEPSRLGRLFRLGSAPADPAKSGPASGLGGGSGSVSTGTRSSLGADPAPAYRSAAADPFAPPALSTPPAGSSGGAVAPKISPKPRVNKGVTDADPLVTRVALGRADGGSQFAMFTQVFADGTVIDSEGVHKITPELLKPVVEAVSTGEFAKLKGHCGGPAGDTFENYQVVTFERAYGRLRANAFSYSGNPQGCDHAVHHLHKVLDDLQMKMSTPGGAGVNAAPVVVDPPVAGPASAANLAPALAAPAPMAASAGLPMPGLPDPGLH